MLTVHSRQRHQELKFTVHNPEWLTGKTGAQVNILYERINPAQRSAREGQDVHDELYGESTRGGDTANITICSKTDSLGYM